MAALDLIEQAMALLEQARGELLPAEIHVGPGASLVDVLSTLSGGETVVIHPDAAPVTNLRVPVPVTFLGGTLLGGTVVEAPDVAFVGTTFRGTTNGQTILVTADGTIVEDSTLVGSPIGQHRGILVNSRDVTIRNTSITNIWHSIDTQAIFGYDGTDNLLVEGCHLEASGENIMFGGADPSSEANIPRNITVRNCTLDKPAAWRTQAATGCKNLFELKNAINVLVEDCLFEHSYHDAQNGFGIVMTVRNQSGTAPYSTIRDVIFHRNTIRHCSGGISLLGSDNNYPSVPMSNILIEDNTFEDINPSLWGGPNGRLIQIARGGDRITFRRNRLSGGSLNSFLFLTGGPTLPLTNFTFEDNDVASGWYGIVGDGGPGFGKVALDYYTGGAYSWSGNTVRRETGSSNWTYPSGTTVVAA